MRMKLESAAHGSLDLDDVFAKGAGVQALKGATGLGLPDVSVQWLEAAGNGSTYRGTRYLPRDIDLPIYVKGNNHAELTTLLSKISRMLSNKCVLRLIEDDGTEWVTDVYRTGGGGFTYGEDTIGADDLRSIITIRSGSPFFSKATGLTQTVDLTAGPTSGDVATTRAVLTNDGDTDAYPVLRVLGPISGIRVALSGGGSYEWTGSIYNDEWIEFNHAAGTVKDQSGFTRYSELAAAPSFFAIKPGVTTVSITGRVTPAGASGAQSDTLKNWVTNPSFELNASGWTDGRYYVGGGSYPYAVKARDVTQFKYGSASFKLQRDGAAPSSYTQSYTGLVHPLTGLDPNRLYSVHAWVYAPSAAAPSVAGYGPNDGNVYPQIAMFSKAGGGNGFNIATGIYEADYNYTGTSTCYGQWARIDADLTFRPTADGKLWIALCNPTTQVGGAWPAYYWDGIIVLDRGQAPGGVQPGASAPTANTAPYPPQGLYYFDGDSVVNGFTFAWQGTSRASTSVASRTGVAQQAKVTSTVVPQRQVVV